MTVKLSTLDVLDQLGGASSDVVWIRTAHEMLYVSPAYEAIWGRSRRSLYDSPDDFLAMVHPDDRDRLAEAFAACIQGTGDFDAEYRIVRDDGDLRIIHARSRSEIDPHGNLVHEIGLASDVTARRKSEAALRETQRLESLGTLASSIAHDFANVLASITINVDMMKDATGNRADLADRIDDVNEATQQALALCKQLLDYAGDDRRTKTRTDVGREIRSMSSLLSSALPAGGRLDLSNVQTGVSAKVDPSQFTQLVLNLVTNASEALHETGGNVKVSLEPVQLGAGELRTPSFGHRLEPATYVRLLVEDDGRGLDPDQAARIFEPFAGSKGPGRGLGLSTVLRIVRAHAGAIAVDGCVGKGASFEVLLPPDGGRSEGLAEPYAATARPAVGPQA